MERIFEKLDRYFYKKWQIAVLDMDVGRWVVEPKSSNIAYLKAENASGRHILIQPDSTIAPYYFLIDDVNLSLIGMQHKGIDNMWKSGRMVVETSKNNYQIWIHSSRRLSLEEKHYWLKKFNSDPGAGPNNRWGRCPGFRNRKEKHCDSTGGYPLSRLIWIDWKRQAKIPITNSSKIPIKSFSSQAQKRFVSLQKKNFRSNYERDDESETDFAYAIALLRRGYSIQSVYQKILDERTDWKNHIGENKKQHYLERTIKKAKNIVSCS
ncbi:DNA-primase RepB domain-containing protein [Desulfobacterales bacterium HSG17]|nr:DNA-primase RepB domain-containing protein [Desulfobacterales bacterium HSG17]